MAREVPQRPVVTGTFANAVFDKLYAESKQYGSPIVDFPGGGWGHAHPIITSDYWSNSLSCNPKCGVRKLRIRLSGGWDSYHLQQPVPEAHVAEMWLHEMRTIIHIMGADQYVKVYLFMGLPSLAIWYYSHT